MKRMIQILLSPAICAVLLACSRAHLSSNLDGAQIRAKLDAIPVSAANYFSGHKRGVLLFYLLISDR